RDTARIELDSCPQAASAHCADELKLKCTQTFEQMLAQGAAAFDQALIANHAQRFQPDSCGERVAAEGRSVAARSHVVQHCSARDEGRHWQQTTAERLADDDAVRPD